MSSLSSSRADFMEENNSGSGSDTNPDDDAREYYQPISAVDEDDHDGDEQDRDRPLNPYEVNNGFLSNGYLAEDGIQESDSAGEEEEEAPLESEISRAFRDDERRRSAPLSAENAARVMEAMRAVSFPGIAPDWASQVSEDRLIHYLRRLRRPSGPSATAPNQSTFLS